MIHNSNFRLSIAIATFNEEKNLAQCLNSIRDVADEIVIVDGSSTDKTVEIAKSFGARVIVTSNKPIFHLNKQQAIDECKGEWVLQLDADELISKELADEIREVIENDSNLEHVGYWIRRRKMFLGRWIKKGGQYPDPVIRLFRKGKAHLPCKSVHEQMEVNGETGWLKNPIIHLPAPNFSVYITKDNRYSTLTAMEMKEKNVPINFFTMVKYLFLVPIGKFFSLFFRHLGFLDGFPGFVFAFYSGLHQMTAFVKYWEMENFGVKTEDDWV